MAKHSAFLKLVFLACAFCACRGNIEKKEIGYFEQKFEREVVEREAIPFALNDVSLLPGPFKVAQDAEASYLRSLDPDRLLHRFHLYAGLEPKAEIYGGWEQRGVSGHSLGHYLSACAMMYASTNDADLKRKMDYTISELARCQSTIGTGYVGAIPHQDSIFTDLAAGKINAQGFDLNGAWVPWYNLHKTMAGLNDAYIYAANDQALEVNIKFADWIQSQFSDLNEEQFQRMLTCEHGGMNESLADLYAFTGNEAYLTLSRKFNHHNVLEPLAKSQDNLDGLHANTQIPKVVGMARQFALSGISSDSAAAAFFFETVTEHHSYVIGGNSEYEHFGEPDKLSGHLSKATAEGCNTYNMLKLTHQLFGWNAKASYMDYYERAMYNHILASLRPDDGMVCYFMPLESGSHKEYGTPFDSFWCCTGTGMENPAKYAENVFFKGSDSSLIVNLFIPSRLQWKELGIKLELKTEFPLSEKVELQITEGEAEFSMQIRKPGWLKSEPKITLNGECLEPPVNRNGYYVIHHNWKKGDKIELNFPMEIYTEAMPDDSTHIAFLKGPLVLAANVTEQSDKILNGEAVLIADGNSKNAIEATPSSMEYKLGKNTGPLAGATLIPFYQFQGEPHVVYWKQFSEAEWRLKEKDYKAEMARLAAFEAATIDIMRIGEMQPERDHNLQSENSITGEAFGRKYRHAENGWFEFDMKVTDQPVDLNVTYWGGDTGPRAFQIYIDGSLLTDESLHLDAPNSFFDRRYTIPGSILQNKDSITVRFEALPGNTAGGVYGVRTILSSEL